jgi:hypothetical protein
MALETSNILRASEAKEYVRARNVMHDVDGVELVEALLPGKGFYLTFLSLPHIFSCRPSAIVCYSRSREAASQVARAATLVCSSP